MSKAANNTRRIGEEGVMSERRNVECKDVTPNHPKPDPKPPQTTHDTGIGAGDVACRLIHNDTFPSWVQGDRAVLEVEAGSYRFISGRGRLR